jgi:hypothetical protein
VSGGEERERSGGPGFFSFPFPPHPHFFFLSSLHSHAVAHFCHNWGTFILLTWMPTYYNQALGLDIVKSGELMDS